MKKRVIIARLLLVIYLTVVAYLCLHSFKDTPVLPKKIWGYPGDKVIHFLMFTPFPYIAYAAYDKKKYKYAVSFLVALLLIIAGAMVAGGSEIAQYLFTHTRKADLRDFYADMYAIIPGSLVVCLFDLVHSAVINSRKKGRDGASTSV